MHTVPSRPDKTTEPHRFPFPLPPVNLAVLDAYEDRLRRAAGLPPWTA